MNKLIILPGNSPKNKAWEEGVAAAFGSLFDSVYQQSYTHWETGDETIDFDHEANKLRDAISVEAGENHRYVIFAKSFGSILALMSVHRGYIRPEQCVFFGMPFNLVEEQNLFKGDWSPLQTWNIPALAFHNTNDPVAFRNFTRDKLMPVTPIELVTTEGSDHGYFEFESYREKITAFLRL